MITRSRIREIERRLVMLFCIQIQASVVELLQDDPEGVLEGLTKEEALELISSRIIRTKVFVKFE